MIVDMEKREVEVEDEIEEISIDLIEVVKVGVIIILIGSRPWKGHKQY